MSLASDTNLQGLRHIKINTTTANNTLIPPATACGKLMFQPCLSVILLGGAHENPPRNLFTWGTLPVLPPNLHGDASPWTCSNLFTCGLPPPTLWHLSPDLLKLVYYVAHTSISKRAVDLRLKGLFVSNLSAVH